MCSGATPITPCAPATADLAGPHRFYARSWPLRLLERPTAGAPTATPDAGRRPPPLRGPSGMRRPSALNPCSPGGTPRAAEPIRDHLSAVDLLDPGRPGCWRLGQPHPT